MHHAPELPYCGLTIILSQPSRFDITSLLSGNAGVWYCNDVLRPGAHRAMCDIWSVDSFNTGGRKLMPGTKVVLLLGQRAQQEIGAVNTTLGEQRGSPITSAGVIYISSYLPQDCFDRIDHEGRLNPALNSADTSEDDYTDEFADVGKSRHGATSRKNYRFWLHRDTRKAIRICKEGGALRLPQPPTYHIYPSSRDIIDSLRSYANTDFYLDIETDSNLNITCFGYSFGSSNDIFVVPLLRYDYTTAYSNNGAILRGLAYAMDRNTTVAHNGAGFDFFVLPYRYRLPIGAKLYDTMIAHHRVFPEVEKSLGHGISNFTDLPYHKDEGVFEPQNERQEQSLWSYNGKDVFGMRELKRGLEEYARSIPGMPESIAQANASIRPYLTVTLTGMRFNDTERQETIAENDRRLTQYLRLIDAALGKELVTAVRGKSKKGMAGSSSQCATYFHNFCGYPVIKRSMATGKPSVDEKALLKLALKHKNPVIDIVLAYRGVAKESGSLKFTAWKE